MEAVTLMDSAGTAVTLLMAATGEDIGGNFGALLASWARPMFSGVAGIVALMFLVNRRFTDLAVFLAAVVVVGGLVLAPEVVRDSVTGIWQAIAGTGGSGPAR